MNRSSFIQTLRTDWHPMRIIYIVLAIAILAQAWQIKDWAFSLLGVWFLYQGMFNAGCCGAGRSFTSGAGGKTPKTLEDTDFTEIN